MLQKELAKRLKARYDTKIDGNRWLEVSSDGIPLCRIKYNGQFLSNADQNLSDEYRSKIADIQDEISTVREYVGLYEHAPQMKAADVSDYRQLASFGDTVLAATYSEKSGFMFCTWKQNADGDSVFWGDYSPNYEYVKEAFAVRSGLVSKPRLFSEKESADLYRCVGFAKGNCETLTYAKAADPIPFGTYTVKETVFPKDYRAYGKSEWTVTLNKNTPNATITIKAVNELIPGSAKIVKVSEDGKVDGITFRIQGNGIDKTVKTANGGVIQVDNLKPGVYTVTETEYDKYIPQEVRRVTVVSGQVSTVNFSNKLRRGDLTVKKTAEDGLVEGRLRDCDKDRKTVQPAKTAPLSILMFNDPFDHIFKLQFAGRNIQHHVRQFILRICKLDPVQR